MQSLDRFVRILSVLASSGESGLKLTQVARAIDLSLATTMRLLEALIEQGFVSADRDNKTFNLGPELVFLGMAAEKAFPIVRIGRDALDDLAATTGDTAYLSLRSGNHTICVNRVLGSYPVQTLTIREGDRRPLGVGAASIAILATLSAAEADAMLVENESAIAKFPGITLERTRTEIAEARKQGYSFTQNHVVPDVWAVSHVVRSPFGNPLGAVTTAAIMSRFANGRLEFLLDATTRAASRIEERLKVLGGAIGKADMAERRDGLNEMQSARPT
ncbi:IclR family transcriptional regulator [Bradyrhizobium sp.]|uniref:IclR family transcriptional regulator n=1 Tax=Bradyrhizobium sp. TaxID=376 RepID=UPI0039E38787